MNHQLLKTSKVKLYLALADDDTVRPWVEEDMKKVAHFPARMRSGDPEIDSLSMRESDVWSSAQKWLAQKKLTLKRVICDEWKYCSRRAEYGEDYERLVIDIAQQISKVVGVCLAELVATILFKENMFSFCECGGTKRRMQDAIDACNRKCYDDHTLGLFAQIVELDPDNHQAYYYQGFIKLKQHRYEEAIPYYQKALALSPTHPVYLNDLGYLYAYVKNDLETAQDYIALALKMFWDDTENRAASLDSLGWVLCQRGKYIEALKHLSESMELVRRNANTFGMEALQEVLYHVAVTYRGLSDTQNLNKTIQEIQQINPQSIWAEKVRNLSVF